MGTDVALYVNLSIASYFVNDAYSWNPKLTAPNVLRRLQVLEIVLIPNRNSTYVPDTRIEHDVASSHSIQSTPAAATHYISISRTPTTQLDHQPPRASYRIQKQQTPTTSQPDILIKYQIPPPSSTSSSTNQSHQPPKTTDQVIPTHPRQTIH
ncbi:unnamed protein product [Zymoseptoria tritici ST99CH_3D7]|uniref:Uncharacterized protein n=1 Tax=Zymoseptoria tritici (strain ST99CH_3D7) TaxID=1276538 RepID=A0A1X7RWZ0_ZYMT9|nr:unnamed protein product [Zymoseptoria tritici ST99CH_3D7]